MKKRRHNWRFEKTIYRNSITKKLTSPDDPEAVCERVPSKRIRRIGNTAYLFKRNEEGQIEAAPIKWNDQEAAGAGPLFDGIEEEA